MRGLRILLGLVALGVALALGVVGIGWATFPRAAVISYPAAAQILDCNGTVLRQYLATNDTRCYPVALSAMGQWTVAALIAAEDRRFYMHHGVDAAAILRALRLNVNAGRVLSGGSTLPMQLMRIARPRPRTISAKCIEALHALVLDATMTKDEIAALYLNRAPFGGNTLGIEAAAQLYFAKAARDLTLGESALLIGLLQSPSRFRPDRHLDRALVRRAYVLDRMQALGSITAAQRRAAEAERIAIRRAPFVPCAEHFCDMIVRRPEARGVVRTTLDADLQHMLEGIVRTHAAALARQAVYGCAAVVLDVRAQTVVALVGAPDYHDAAHAGQVNGATARRSPGSALKPFVYALAFDRGMLVPDTVLGDVPMQFHDYRPRNFSDDFRGLVSARDALALSLNIPALAVTERIGPAAIVEFLRNAGCRSLSQPADRYGLALTLGACELGLLELANAYACLAREGRYAPLRFTEREAAATPRTLMSPEAAWLVADTLSDAAIAHTAGLSVPDGRMPRIAWKTGTSSGARDAWTMAYNPAYVVGVWCGNPDGRAGGVMRGNQHAAPIAFDIFRQLYAARAAAPWFAQPAGITSRVVCAVSGQALGPHCPRRAVAHVIRGVSDPTPCCVHQLRPPMGGDGAWTVAEVWPPAVQRYLRNARPAPLTITTPSERGTYRLIASDVPNVNMLALQAAASDAAGALYWFIDDTCVGVCAPGATVPWPLRPGAHRIVCCDANGNVARGTFLVEHATLRP